MVRTGYFRAVTSVTTTAAAILLALLMASYALAPAPAEAATATDTLKQPPFTPTDTGLFIPQVYSDALLWNQPPLDQRTRLR